MDEVVSAEPMVNQKAKLEEVFKTSGLPTHTFVEPKKYETIVH